MENTKYCQPRADLKGMHIPIGNEHVLLTEPIPYRWAKEENEEFEVFYKMEWQSAESIDFEFSDPPILPETEITQNYTLRLSDHLTGNSAQKRIVIECSDSLVLESRGIYKESDPKVKHAEQIVETLNKHQGKRNYFLVSDNHNAMGILAFGELKTDAQKDGFVAKLLQIINDHYSCDDCGINSIDDFMQNYFDGTNGIYGSHLWYQDECEKYESMPFTIEKLPLY